MNEQQRTVIMSGRLVNYKNGFLTANGIFVRRDVEMPSLNEEVKVVNEESGQVFDGEVTRLNWVQNSYDIRVRIE